MNLKKFVERERKSVHTLMKEHGWKPNQFDWAKPDDVIRATKDLDSRYKSFGYINNPPKRLPVIWETGDYYNSTEGDYILPSTVLAELKHAEEQVAEWEKSLDGEMSTKSSSLSEEACSECTQ